MRVNVRSLPARHLAELPVEVAMAGREGHGFGVATEFVTGPLDVMRAQMGFVPV